MIILLLPIFLFFFDILPADAAPPQYDIVAAYSEEDRRIYGSEKITITNDGTEPLSELYLFLYPNLYLEKDPDVDPTFYKQAYPVNFNSGEQVITSIQDMRGQNLPYFPDLFKKRILMKIRLPIPIQPKAQFDFLVHFVTTIPEKYGVFGQYRNLVTLQGGWHPYLPYFDGKWNFLLPPRPSRYRIHFTLNEHLDLITPVPSERENEEGSEVTFLLQSDVLATVSLAIGKDLVKKERKVGSVDLVYHFHHHDKAYARQVFKIAEEATAHFLKRVGPLPPTRLEMVESYLYQDLVASGSNLLYISHRIYKVFPLLKRFHEGSIARSVFLLLWRERLPWEESWVIEGLADFEVSQFVRTRYGGPPSLEKWLSPISFIPLIDQILYSKDIPLRQIYFRERVTQAVNEDIQLFNHPRPEGTAIFSKLENLLGHETTQRAVEDYRRKIEAGEKVSFREVLYQISGKKLDWFFEQWLMSNPVLDFGIEKIEKEHIEEGYKTTLTIKKHGEGIEPLEILVTQENGSKIPLVWEGDQGVHQEVLITPSPIDVVELDPHRESSDPNRLNNRVPRLWKILLNRFGGSYNINTHVLSYEAGLLFQPVYDNKNRIGFGFSHSDVGSGTQLDFSHIFKNSHTISVGLSYQGPQTPKDKPKEDPAGVAHLGYSLSYPNNTLLVSSIQRLTGRYPRFSIGFGYDQRFTGGKYEHLFTAVVDMHRTFSFANYHEIGTHAMIGQSFGNLFQNSRFFLGGDQGMRGFTPLRYEGDNIVLLSAEYRFPLFYESDINLIGMAHTHTLLGALFADLGTVTDSRNVFQPSDYKKDIGMGIRWYIDALGFYPTIVRLDVAIPVGPVIESEKKIHYYVAGGFPF
ncbi:MAG: BamA/TamA family outer membrane protein [Nitrospirae bacterium]|nr:BamA/TamA family outer membrane protein [Candidatus Manganitrophaceae bacterium]